MAGARLGARVRAARHELALTQAQLASRAGVSRQLVGAVEAGRHLPRVDAALSLAAALGTTVEALLADDPHPAAGILDTPADGSLVQLARVGDRLVCAPVTAAAASWCAADAVVRDGRPDRFDPERPAAVVAGCDPAIEVAAQLQEARPGPRTLAVVTSSAVAVRVVAEGRAHAAVVHAPGGAFETPPAPVRRWRVARWQVGLAAPATHQRGWVDDALAGRVAVVQREAGAGSQAAFERAVTRVGAIAGTVAGPRVGGHAEAARRAVTDGSVAVTIEPAALAAGLAFHPLETHESELWVGEDHLDAPAVLRFLDELTGTRLRRRLEAVGGYDLSDRGTRVAA